MDIAGPVGKVAGAWHLTTYLHIVPKFKKMLKLYINKKDKNYGDS
jgi:hypothetical protein